MKSTGIFTLAVMLVSICFIACYKEDIDAKFSIENISMGNYPKVDCSTSTSLLQTLIACKLLGVQYEWQENLLFGGYYVLNIKYNEKGSKAFFDGLKVSTTNGVDEFNKWRCRCHCRVESYYYNTYFEQPELVKALAVDGIAPNKENIRNRKYPYTTEVVAAIRSDLDKNSMAYKLYELLCSGNAEKIIEESGYVAK